MQVRGVRSAQLWLCLFLVYGNCATAQIPADYPKTTVLAGSVISFDKAERTIELRTRCGSSTEPNNWKSDSAFKVDELQLRFRAEPENVRLHLAGNVETWRLDGSKLNAMAAGAIEPGAPVIVRVRKTGSSFEGEKNGLEITSLVLLQACIEESCSKAKCKGGADCKEKLCDCPKK